MTDLKHWDFADEFTPQEAASLILGVDPMIVEQSARAKPILEKLRKSYQSCWGYWHTRADGVFEVNEDATLPNDAIESVEMRIHIEFLMRQKMSDVGVEVIDRWLGHGTSEDGEFSGFLLQKFSRNELIRWLKVVGFDSVYKFSRDKDKTDTQIEKRERETLLAIIAVLCKEAKVDYKTSSKAAELIHSTAAFMGVSISETTIKTHLKKIPNALETRMK